MYSHTHLLLFLFFFSYLTLHNVSGQIVSLKRNIQFSVTPGIGTNGFYPERFDNNFSFNLISGYSSRNNIFEIAGVSNLNQNGTTGFQMAGFFNLTGVNWIAGLTPKQIDLQIKSGALPSLAGSQMAGISNTVVGNVTGLQLAGIYNVSRGYLSGVQVAGLFNTVREYSFGLQISGLLNVSKASMNGVMIGGLFNGTTGQIQGFQAAIINYAGIMKGITAIREKSGFGVQIGVVNSAGQMNGYQIGLINFARTTQGTQIGLVNIYKRPKTTDSKDGSSIGLVNIGALGYVSAYSDELFRINYDLATGNSKNTRIKLRRNNRYLVNSLIYSRGGYKNDVWAVGYGLKKMIFNLSTKPGMDEFNFFALEFNILHINQKANTWTSDPSVLSRLKMTAGTRLSPKVLGLYVFGGLSLNFFSSNNGFEIAQSSIRLTKSNGKRIDQAFPGVTAGFLIH